MVVFYYIDTRYGVLSKTKKKWKSAIADELQTILSKKYGD
jgi:hypothetical protein